MVSRRKRFSLRWKRAGLGLRLILLVTGAALFALLTYWSAPGERPGSNILVFVLVNLIIVIICVLAFLVGRNVVKLIFDRRKNLLGSRLKLKLVAAFVGLSLVPLVFLYIFASGLLTRAIEDWFSSQVETSVTGAVEVARSHYAFVKETVEREGKYLVREVESSYGRSGMNGLRQTLELERKRVGLYSVQVLHSNSKVLVEDRNIASTIDAFREPAPDGSAVSQAMQGNLQVLSEERDYGHFIRAYLPVDIGNERNVLVATKRINPELTHAFNAVNNSYKEYEETKLLKKPLKSSALLTLTMITGLILFSAVWIAFYLAKEIAVPVQRLAEGVQAVAAGNYNVQVRVAGDDEISFLVRSFNSMTADLKRSTAVAERRRVYIETILSNLAVGVIAVDTTNRVTVVNSAAARILGCNERSVINCEIGAVLRPQDFEEIRPLLEVGQMTSDAYVAERTVSERQMTVVSEGTELKIICTAGQMMDAQDKWLGTVLIFDDITELAKAQHMSAWREVARRIAHEIKNPLTPIQLSAQRLQRLVLDNPVVTESAETIVQNVNSIKRLADEFSNFARMPTAELQESDLNSLISETISPFAESHSGIVFQLIADNKLPSIMIDREQIRRAIINLLDNAIAAIGREDGSVNAGGGKIVIKTSYDRRTKQCYIEVADSGPGIKSPDKTRVFEPYFTTKKKGTGLGLAIVTSIVADHQGQIRVYDNQPNGAKFIIELPLTPKDHTQRRFVSGV